MIARIARIAAKPEVVHPEGVEQLADAAMLFEWVSQVYVAVDHVVIAASSSLAFDNALFSQLIEDALGSSLRDADFDR